MSLGIFVEGPSDRETIPILIKKTGFEPAVHARWVRGNLLDFTEMSHLIESLLIRRRGIESVLIMIDSEGVDPERTLRSSESTSRRLTEHIGIAVRYVIVDHSLEGWLACDQDALRAVLGNQAKIPIKGNPEDHLRPAHLMSSIFRQNGRDFVKTRHNRMIAEHVTPANIAAKSPTFRRLVTLLAG